MEERYKNDKRARYNRDFAIDYIHEYGIDVEKRDIFLFGEDDMTRFFEGNEPGVEYMMSNKFIKNLSILQSLSSDPILIYMKTCGGDYIEGMAIYNAIKACPNFVTILNYTHARSMSSIILQAADKRIMMPDSTFMYHDGTVGFEGTVKQLETEFEQSMLAKKRMMEIYLDAAEGSPAWEGKSRNQIEKILRTNMDRKEEVYLSAEEAVRQGFADSVFDYDWSKIRGA